MSLDADCRKVLDIIVAAGRPKLWQVTPAEARLAMLASIKLFGGPAPEVAQVRDLKTGGGIRLRLYRPLKSGSGPLPTLVFYHGGGYVIGDLDSHDIPCRMLANASGCVVVSVDYRLAPEHPFPAGIEDALAALRWIAAEAGRIGVDSGRLAVGGDSAGGNFAAVTAQRARDEGGPDLRFQLLIYPATDQTAETESKRLFGEGYLLEDKGMAWFRDHYLGPDEAKKTNPWASPAKAPSLAGLPPAMVVTAGFDPLRDEGKAYADALTKAGVATRYRCHDGLIHGFINFPGAIAAAGPALSEMGQALAAALR
ncbi:MAG: alpha/beta hydrolase [Alphaproteobacteria bacterium]|nr:alpha/beta hydrolase [Alphaproteobacteria bacterium]